MIDVTRYIDIENKFNETEKLFHQIIGEEQRNQIETLQMEINSLRTRINLIEGRDVEAKSADEVSSYINRIKNSRKILTSENDLRKQIESEIRHNVENELKEKIKKDLEIEFNNKLNLFKDQIKRETGEHHRNVEKSYVSNTSVLASPGSIEEIIKKHNIPVTHTKEEYEQKIREIETFYTQKLEAEKASSQTKLLETQKELMEKFNENIESEIIPKLSQKIYTEAEKYLRGKIEKEIMDKVGYQDKQTFDELNHTANNSSSHRVNSGNSKSLILPMQGNILLDIDSGWKSSSNDSFGNARRTVDRNVTDEETIHSIHEAISQYKSNHGSCYDEYEHSSNLHISRIPKMSSGSNEPSPIKSVDNLLLNNNEQVLRGLSNSNKSHSNLVSDSAKNAFHDDMKGMHDFSTSHKVNKSNIIHQKTDHYKNGERQTIESSSNSTIFDSEKQKRYYSFAIDKLQVENGELRDQLTKFKALYEKAINDNNRLEKEMTYLNEKIDCLKSKTCKHSDHSVNLFLKPFQDIMKILDNENPSHYTQSEFIKSVNSLISLVQGFEELTGMNIRTAPEIIAKLQTENLHLDQLQTQTRGLLLQQSTVISEMRDLTSTSFWNNWAHDLYKTITGERYRGSIESLRVALDNEVSKLAAHYIPIRVSAQRL